MRPLKQSQFTWELWWKYTLQKQIL